MPAVHGHKASSVEPYNSGTDNRSPHHVINNWVGGAPTIISNVTPRSHNRDPDYCFLSEEWNPVQKKPQQI